MVESPSCVNEVPEAVEIRSAAEPLDPSPVPNGCTRMLAMMLFHPSPRWPRLLEEKNTAVIFGTNGTTTATAAAATARGAARNLNRMAIK